MQSQSKLQMVTYRGKDKNKILRDAQVSCVLDILYALCGSEYEYERVDRWHGCWKLRLPYA